MFTDFVVVGVQPTDVAKFYEIPATYRPVEVVVTRDFVTVSELIFNSLTVCPYGLCVFIQVTARDGFHVRRVNAGGHAEDWCAVCVKCAQVLERRVNARTDPSFNSGKGVASDYSLELARTSIGLDPDANRRLMDTYPNT